MEKVAERQAVQGSGMAGDKKYYSDTMSLQEILGNWVRYNTTGAERARCAQVAESLVRSGAGSHDPAATTRQPDGPRVAHSPTFLGFISIRGSRTVGLLRGGNVWRRWRMVPRAVVGATCCCGDVTPLTSS